MAAHNLFPVALSSPHKNIAPLPVPDSKPAAGEALAVFWTEFQQHNEHGLYKIYHELYDNLYHYGISVVLDQQMVKEAINDVFVELWKKREQLIVPDHIPNYIFICFKRRLSKLLGKEHKRSAKYAGQLFQEPEEQSYEAVLIGMEADTQLRHKMEKVLAQLTARQKEFIRLRFYENMSMEEISLKTSASVRTIYNTLHTAMVQLRRILSFFSLTLLWYLVK
ncbi:RNA polymerase sigma factor (sigma-70 family) [Chitinophaga polysaccharea]|uniref:RNA polymerase sigma factor (Sigma-70 family) n=1 Tax=Chitinophaga polysaccharea TaxID=1293035 RepID=A0A561PW43_9BACT|nr:sigma-70 family RNA polymerase sigma factor [Chitinophaga polysaccharea]TWF42331.1 RNA polymerase sigma factor (sigma-70 family) [Chitinophaga polysaccharea]